MEIKRILEAKLQEELRGIGAILISGPKYCGKTYLGEKYSKSKFAFGSLTKEEISLLSNESILNGEKPRLIDEWQEYPHIWNLVRIEVDKVKKFDSSLYIMTGSSSPFDWQKIKHTGAGRILTLTLSTLTYAEILDVDDKNSFSLKQLINKTQTLKNIQSPVSLEQSCNMLITGGWPSIWSNKASAYVVDSMLEGLTKQNYDGMYKFYVSKNNLKNVLKSLARLTTTQIKDTTILSDINNEVTLNTLKKYKSVLYDQDVLFDIPVFNPTNMRSKYKIRTTPKTYFCDTSIVCNLLNIKSQSDLFNDLNTAGIIFENQVIKDLRVYAQAIDADLYFYRDEKDNEIDAIIQLHDGNWIPVEIKLSNKSAINSIDKLNKTIQNINIQGKFNKPLFKLFITNDSESSILKDDTYIIPHALLKP